MNRSRTRGGIGYCTMLMGILASLALLISACGPGAAPTATPTTAPVAPTPTRAAAATPTAVRAVTPTPTAPPKASGLLRVAIATFTNGLLDPKFGSHSGVTAHGGAIFDSLVGTTAEGKPGPGIAERWEMSSDGKTWTFYIRKGVKFHNGDDVTAADVKFSVDRILADAKATASYAGSLRPKIANIELIDPYTAVFNLKQPDPELWANFSLQGGGEGGIVPKKYVEERGENYLRDNPVGSGPWRFARYDFGNVLELEAVEGHWRATPQFQKVTIMNVPEDATRVALVKTVGVDLAQIPLDSVDEIKKTSGARVARFAEARGSFYNLYYDPNDPGKYPIGDRRVRRALSLAINREELAKSLMQGYATAMGIYNITGWSVYFNKDAASLRPDPYDPTEAKRLLAEAGYPNGFNIKVYSATGMHAALPTILEAVAGYWSKIGVKPSIVTGDWAGMRPMIYPTVKPDLFGGALGLVGSMSPALKFDTYLTSSPQTTHRNAQVDAAVQKAIVAIDMAERKKAVEGAAILIKEEAYRNGLLFLDDLYGVGKNIGDWTPIPGAPLLALEYERIPHPR